MRGERALRQRVHESGVQPAARREVWKFLLGFYPMDSSATEVHALRSALIPLPRPCWHPVYCAVVLQASCLSQHALLFRSKLFAGARQGLCSACCRICIRHLLYVVCECCCAQI